MAPGECPACGCPEAETLADRTIHLGHGTAVRVLRTRRLRCGCCGQEHRLVEEVPEASAADDSPPRLAANGRQAQ